MPSLQSILSFLKRSSVISRQSSAKNNQRGSIQMILLIVLLVGVVVSTYLVQNRSQLFSQAASTDKATIKDRSESVGADGTKEIKFTWSDGRVSYDFKDSNGNLIKGRAYATRGGQRSTPTGEQVQGNTYITNWSDGTVEYNVFTDGKYDLNKSYAMAGGSSSTTKTPAQSTTKKTEPTKKTTPATTKTTTPTTTTPKTTTPTTTSPTTTKPTTSSITVNAQATKTQLTSLKQAFDQIVAKISQSGKNNSDLQGLIEKTNLSITSAIAAVDSCISSQIQGCDQQLTPLLNYARVAARLTSFGAITAQVPEVCTRADFGIDPAIIVTSTTNIVGPLYLCSGTTPTELKWRVFDTANNPLTLNDLDAAKWKPNLTITALPQDMLNKLGAAQTLILGQTNINKQATYSAGNILPPAFQNFTLENQRGAVKSDGTVVGQADFTNGWRQSSASQGSYTINISGGRPGTYTLNGQTNSGGVWNFIIQGVPDPQGLHNDQTIYGSPINRTFSMKHTHDFYIRFNTSGQSPTGSYSNLSVLYNPEIIGTPIDN